MTSSILEPVSVSAVARMESEPPFSIFRAEPKNLFGLCKILDKCEPAIHSRQPSLDMSSKAIQNSRTCCHQRNNKVCLDAMV